MPFVVVYKQPSAGDTGFVRRGEYGGGNKLDGAQQAGMIDQYVRG